MCLFIKTDTAPFYDFLFAFYGFTVQIVLYFPCFGTDFVSGIGGGLVLVFFDLTMVCEGMLAFPNLSLFVFILSEYTCPSGGLFG